MLFGAARQGARDGLLLGAATAGYVLTEEGAGKLRRIVQDSTVDGPGWKGKAVDRGKPVEGYEWVDGGVAGGVMGLAISLLCELVFDRKNCEWRLTRGERHRRPLSNDARPSDFGDGHHTRSIGGWIANTSTKNREIEGAAGRAGSEGCGSGRDAVGRDTGRATHGGYIANDNNAMNEFLHFTNIQVGF
jgi:hypothetical protein